MIYALFDFAAFSLSGQSTIFQALILSLSQVSELCNEKP